MTEPRRRIVLWTAPRSVSTAFERAFINRSSCHVEHEPIARPYHFGPDRLVTRFKQETDDTMEVVKQRLIQEAGSGKDILFVKELAYVAVQGLGLLKDDEIGPCPTVAASALEPELSFLQTWTNTFIIRDPREQLPSLVAQLRRVYKDPKDYSLLHETGVGPLHRLFHFVTDVLEQEPIVVDSGDLRRNPEGTLRAYCEAVGIEFEEGMLSWNKKGGEMLIAGSPPIQFSDKHYLPTEDVPQWSTWSLQGWHDTASNTSTFLPVSSTIEKEKRAAILHEPEIEELLGKCLPVYQEMFDKRLIPLGEDRFDGEESEQDEPGYF